MMVDDFAIDELTAVISGHVHHGANFRYIGSAGDVQAMARFNTALFRDGLWYFNRFVGSVLNLDLIIVPNKNYPRNRDECR